MRGADTAREVAGNAGEPIVRPGLPDAGKADSLRAEAGRADGADAGRRADAPQAGAADPVRAALARMAGGEKAGDVLAGLPDAVARDAANAMARASSNAKGKLFARTAKAAAIARNLGGFAPQAIAQRARAALGGMEQQAPQQATVGKRGALPAQGGVADAAAQGRPPVRANGKSADGSAQVVIRGDEIGPRDMPTAQLREKAFEWATKHFLTDASGNRIEKLDVINAPTNAYISVTRQGIKHALAGKSATEIRLIAGLRQMLEQALPLGEPLKDRKGRSKDILAVHLFRAQAVLDGEQLKVGVVVREMRDGRRFYDQFIIPDAKNEMSPLGTSGAASRENGKLDIQPANGDDSNGTTNGGASKTSSTAGIAQSGARKPLSDKPASVDSNVTPSQRPPSRSALAKQAIEQRADYFTPGNIVRGYAKNLHDRVIAYTPPDERGNWSVKVRAVKKEGDAWVDAPYERERIHSTQPQEQELKAGPVQRAPAATIEKSSIVAPGDKSRAAEPSADEQRQAFHEAEKRRRAAGNRARSTAWEANPLRAFLGKHGLALDLRPEFAPGRTEQRQAMVPGYGPIFRKSGLPLDKLARAAVEEGFLTQPDERALYGLIQRVFRGERVIPQYAEGAVEAEMHEQFARRREMEEDRAPQIIDDMNAAMDDFPGEDFVNNETYEDYLRSSRNLSEQEIQDELRFYQDDAPYASDRPASAREGTQGGEGLLQPAARDARGSDGSAHARTGAQEEHADFELTRPTQGELADSAARQKAQEDKQKADEQAAERKAQADRQRGEFTLTGSDRAADANPAQDNLFSGLEDTADKPMFQRGAEIPGERPSVDALNELAGKVAERLPNLPKVHVLAGQEQAPRGLREGAEAAGGAKAAVYKGQVYLFADRVGSMAEAEHLLATHEANHVGLAGVLGSGREAMMQSIARRNPLVMREAEAFMQRHGVDVAEAVEEVLADKTPREMAGLKGWRAVTVAAGRWLAPRYPELARQVRKWLNGKLSEQQRADLAVADLLQAGRDYLSGKGDLGRRGAADARAVFGRDDGTVFSRGAVAHMARQLAKPERVKATAEFLRGDAVAEAKADALNAGPGESASGKAARERVVRWFKENGITEAVSHELGVVKISPRSIDESIWHGFWRGKLAGFTVLRDVIERGKVLHADLGYKGDTHDRAVIGAPVKIGGEDYLMGVLLKADEKGSRYYLHEVTLTPKEKPLPSSELLAGEKSSETSEQQGFMRSVLRNAYEGNAPDHIPDAGQKAGPTRFSRADDDADVRFRRGGDDEPPEPAAQAKAAAAVEAASPRAPGESHEAWQRRLMTQGSKDMEAALREDALHKRDTGRGMLREMFARRERTMEQANAAFGKYTRYFDKAGDEANLKSIDQYETGGAQAVTDPLARPFFVAMDKGFEQRAQRIQKLAPDAMRDLVEHYFPHIWEDPTKAAQSDGGAAGEMTASQRRKFCQRRKTKNHATF